MTESVQNSEVAVYTGDPDFDSMLHLCRKILATTRRLGQIPGRCDVFAVAEVAAGCHSR